jgi:predicted metal-dependent hydrolase
VKSIQLELPFQFLVGIPASPAQIILGNKVIDYRIRRRRRGSITLTIDDRGLRVGAPRQASTSAIEREVRRHERWILRKLAEWEERRGAMRRWVEGEIVMVLGEPLRLAYAAPAQTTLRERDTLFVATGAPPHPAEIVRRVVAWLRDEALSCFRFRAAHHAPLLEVGAPEIQLSNARTRWGSCHAGGWVHLNWRLIHLPLRLVDYVVVHELAHLREMNHSPRFWRLVAGILPDCMERRREIRTEAHRYLLE